jgi:hypothetical protein
VKLKGHHKGITNVEDWYSLCPPKKGEKQWVSGRSAMELAKYVTKNLPYVPIEIENALKTLIPKNVMFEWDAEYVTDLPGKGEGRNHDAIFYNSDIVVTIEAKADETFGNLIGEELHNASVNKLHRISEMLRCIFKGGFKEYGKLRYQLLTASVGTILEAQTRDIDTAVLLIVVFKSNGNIEEDKLAKNHGDIEIFLEAAGAYEENGFMVIPNKTGIKLYFKEIII